MSVGGMSGGILGSEVGGGLADSGGGRWESGFFWVLD